MGTYAGYADVPIPKMFQEAAMPKQIKPLNDVQIANAKPGAKPKTLFDGGGLYLEVTPAGGKLWRLKYRFNGAARLLALGKYPDVSLRDARERRENARKLLTNGADPGKEKKALKAAEAARATNTFRRVAESWCAIWRHGVAEDTANRIWSNLERNVFPIIGDALIDEIKPKAIMDVLRTMEARGVTDSVRKARSAISMITRYAVQNDLTEYDPAPSTKGGIQPYKVKHMPALLSPEAVADYLRRLDAYQGRYETHAALNLLPLLFVRPGELRKMRWAELDLEKAEWKYFVTKTKT
ncbi:MAG: integrase arm-type DNA-binding domain-containing protein, partial [Candidatus Accumulibacter sp.]|nr:integrase arm-type DNA-binding domain-containing protein [Accumulibacter sp.]